MEEYFSGNKLYGNDFTFEQVKKWFEEEEEGYAGLKKKEEQYRYQYDAMNQHFGYKHLNESKFANVLGLGSAYGHEFLPIISKIENLFILEPSQDLRSKTLGHIMPKYVKPEVDGTIKFADESFDLITSFGVLHHIPNVSYVLKEMVRVLKPEGTMLIREPIRSMGDWRKQRNGLTKNERGIPLTFFRSFFRSQENVEIAKETLMDAAFMYKMLKKLKLPINRNTLPYQKFDEIISKLFRWNITYHPRNAFKKCAPATVYYVIIKK
jgi:SAM-dependent methyltransferase